MNYGSITINLDSIIKEKGISKTQLSYKAELSFTQINKLCKDETTRLDLHTLSKLCTVLDCKIEDILVFEPPIEM